MHIISSHQCRAGRALLNWSQEELAENAHVSRATIVDFEAFNRVPIKNNLRSIADCLFAAGVEMIAEDGVRGVGVRFRNQKIEYSKNIHIDRFNRHAIIKMSYMGEYFQSYVSLDAIDDYHRKDFKTDEEFSTALSEILHIIISAAERHAPQKIRDGILRIEYEMLVREN